MPVLSPVSVSSSVVLSCLRPTRGLWRRDGGSGITTEGGSTDPLLTRHCVFTKVPGDVRTRLGGGDFLPNQTRGGRGRDCRIYGTLPPGPTSSFGGGTGK